MMPFILLPFSDGDERRNQTIAEWLPPQRPISWGTFSVGPIKW
jgi:hypothetical protein